MDDPIGSNHPDDVLTGTFLKPGNVYDDKLYLLHDVHTEVFDPETMRWSSWPQPPPTSPDQVISNGLKAF